jgi:uncharacterized protein (TIGR00730 family)
MPIVRLSGRIFGKDDPKRKERAELIYRLYSSGWDIYNGNGDQTIHLENIQKKIIDSDAFVFTQNPDLEDYFNLTSIFVGLQTLDGDLKDKPTVIVNSDKSWDDFISLVNHLHKLGTVKENIEQYLHIVSNNEEMTKILDSKLERLDSIRDNKLITQEPDFIDAGTVINSNKIKQPDFNVCVFCSASIKKQTYLDEGYALGKKLAELGWGCISGAGKTGIMGQVVKGAYENGGWSGGSNVPHIIRLEGLPDGLNEFWPRADIYTRMEIMIAKSDAFIIMPGGMGTVQELIALLLLKQKNHDLMKGKKIVIFNKFDEDNKVNFWQPLIKLLLNNSDLSQDIKVTDDMTEVLKLIK